MTTQKSQITISEEKVDHIIIKPAIDILDIAGSFKSKKKKLIIEARKRMEKIYIRI